MTQLIEEGVSIGNLEFPAGRVRKHIFLSLDVGHRHQEVVTYLDVGEELEKGGDEGMRRAKAYHPRQGRGAVCEDVDVGGVARGAGNRGGDQSQRNNSSKKFFDVD